MYNRDENKLKINKNMHKKRKKYSNENNFSKKPQKKEKIILGPNDVIGIYAPGKWDYGFVDVEDPKTWEKQWYYVYGRNSKNAFPGDKVLAFIKVFKGKKEAVVKKIIEHRKQPIVGIYQQSGKFWFVVSKDKNIRDVFIPGKLSREAKNGEMVACEIVRWEGKSPEGKIIKILGDPEKRWVDILAIAMEAGTRVDFWKPVLEEVEKHSIKISHKEISKIRLLSLGTAPWVITK